MRTYRLLCTVAFVAHVAVAADAQPLRDLVGKTFPATVVGVVDGDTIDVLRPGTRQNVRIRLDGIDCPESGEPFSRQALNLTRVLAFDQAVIVEGKDVDRYGRLVARIKLGSKDVSVELVSAGLACHYRKYSSDPVLARAEADATSSGRGFWAAGARQPACVAREAGNAAKHQIASATDGPFVGNVQSHIYHAPSCRNANCKNCTRPFINRAEAEAAGFRPAGDCVGKR